ncbi:MAG: hypothetical protein A3C13_04400 [Candidatus Lloydbacteria bacterium RIFCSPHIGHO2_02_FULL_50_11]|nr:MAG: hypothetical protein A3C13_04400 [Candidatus Lloydbacteria bacterium RIFCSPHIGHO2_02_FULL_50_11]
MEKTESAWTVGGHIAATLLVLVGVLMLFAGGIVALAGLSSSLMMSGAIVWLSGCLLRSYLWRITGVDASQERFCWTSKI